MKFTISYFGIFSHEFPTSSKDNALHAISSIHNFGIKPKIKYGYNKHNLIPLDMIKHV